MDSITSPRLTLVHSRDRGRTGSAAFIAENVGPQAALFAQAKPGVVVFLDFSAIESKDFGMTMENAKPGWVFDMRLVPYFDVGNLNRRRAFDFFDQAHATYVDVAAPLMSGFEREDAMLRMADLLRSGRVDLHRPMVFLMDRGSCLANDSEILALLAATGQDVKEVVFGSCL